MGLEDQAPLKTLSVISFTVKQAIRIYLQAKELCASFFTGFSEKNELGCCEEIRLWKAQWEMGSYMD